MSDKRDGLVAGLRRHTPGGLGAAAAALLLLLHPVATDACDENSQFMAFDAAPGDRFGSSIDIDGDTAIVGSFVDDSGFDSGAAYIIRRQENGIWTQLADLTPADGEEFDRFGAAVAIDGNFAVIGANLDDEVDSNSGAVYIYRTTNGTTWSFLKKLTASDADGSDQFGSSVDLSGDTLIVGAPQDEDGGNLAGSAYIFQRNEGGANNWGEVTKILPGDASSGDRFGIDVAISGNNAIIGAYLDGQGSAYAFQRNQGGVNNWGQVKKITVKDPAAFNFGFAVAVSGDFAVIGAWGDQGPDGDAFTGSAYVFSRNTDGVNQWGQMRKLYGSRTQQYGVFGRTVDISGDTIVVGAEGFTAACPTCTGEAYVFRRSEGGMDNWGEIAHLTGSTSVAGDTFGAAVAVDGDEVLIGSPRSDFEGGEDAGALYLYDVDNCIESCPGDIDRSGLVDVEDLILLLDYYGSSSTSVDLNRDGSVDRNDLTILIDRLGPCGVEERRSGRQLR